MGFFLSTIETQIPQLNRKGKWVEPLYRIKEYHGLFKSVCDSFLIEGEQFIQIFQSTDKIKIWDAQETGKIDALQLFCGLICFANQCTFRDKLRMIFTIFDFNEIKSISFVDLCYMVLCICNSTYKILNKNAKTNQTQISKWLNMHFSNIQRINITRLYKFCSQVPQVYKYFIMITSQTKQKLQLEKQLENIQTMKKIGTKMIQKHSQIQKKQTPLQINQKINFYLNFLQKIMKVQQNSSKQHKCAIDWIYGIRINDLLQPFILFQNINAILYTINTVMILYLFKQKQQRIYDKHQGQITIFTVNNLLVASAEHSSNQTNNVHIWCPITLKTLKIIRTMHTNNITLMKWMNKDQYIITANIQQQNTPILIYEVQTQNLYYSFLINETIINFTNVTSFVNNDHKNIFMSVYSEGLYKIELKPQTQSRNIHTSLLKYQYPQSYSKITCSLVLQININNPYLRYLFHKKSLSNILLSGHQNGYVCILHLNQQNAIDDVLLQLQIKITCMKHTNDGIIISYDCILSFYDYTILINKNIPPNRIINLQHQFQLTMIKIFNYKILYFQYQKDKIIIVNKQGQFIKINQPSIIYNKQEKQYDQLIKIQILNNLINLSGPLNAMCIIHKIQDIILVSNSSYRIFAINNKQHSISYCWELPSTQIITAIDAIYTDQCINFVVCGCNSGRVYIRINQEQYPKFCDCLGPITSLKLSPDSSYLLTITKQNCLMFFTQVNMNFTSPRRLYFENQIPISINFLDNYKFFMVNTSAQNIYLVEVPQLKNRIIDKDNQNISISKMMIKYPIVNDTRNYQLNYSFGYMGGDTKFALICQNNGQIYFFQSNNALQQKNYRILQLHKGKISNICVSNDQQYFYSLGKYDSSLVKWKVSKNEVKSNKFHSIYKQNVKDIQQFQNIKLNNFYNVKSQKKQSLINSVYYLEGTKISKLNEKLRNIENSRIKWDTVHKTKQLNHPLIKLKLSLVLGITQNNKYCLKYFDKQGQNIIHYVSRFIISTNLDNKKQDIRQPSDKKINCLVLGEKGQIIYSQIEKNPKIYIYGCCKRTIITTHLSSIIHLTIYKKYILSYGISNQGYSINLHNYVENLLIQQKFTHLRVHQFVMFNQFQFISLKQVRLWTNLFPTSILCYATAATLLQNGKDICLGSQKGSFLIITTKGIIYTILQYAHQNQITHLKLNEHKQSIIYLISISLDTKIKLWDKKFQCQTIIDLLENNILGFISYNGKESNHKNRIMVNCIDVISDKILLLLNSGQTYEILLKKILKKSNHNKKNHNNPKLSINKLLLKKNNIINNQQNDSILQDYQYQKIWIKILDFHYNNCTNNLSNFIHFTIHMKQFIIASINNSNQLLFHNYKTNNILNCYLFQTELTSIKFANQNNLLIIGFKSGAIHTYIFNISSSNNYLHQKNKNYDDNNNEQNQSKNDNINDSFNKNNNINETNHQNIILHKIQSFNQYSTANYFVFSIVFSKCCNYLAVSLCPFTAQSSTIIQVYKMKEKNIEEEQQIYYYLYYTIELESEQKYKNNNYIKSVSKMSFTSLIINNIVQQLIYLVCYEQYFDKNFLSINKFVGKYKIYNLKLKNLVNQEYKFNNWKEIDFATFIYIDKRHNKIYEKQKLKEKEEQQQEQQISAITMSHIDQCIIYGLNDGKLLLVNQSSITQCLDNANKLIIDQMHKGLLHGAHTSQILQLQICNKWLFSTSIKDECIICWQIQNNQNQLDDIKINNPNDIHEQYMNHQNFLTFINDIYPIRSQITDILQDTQTYNNYQYLQKISIIGRRSYDRRNNIIFDGQYLLYTIGTNIILYNIYNKQQKSLKYETNNFSSSISQISCINKTKNYLLLSTQQQHCKIIIYNYNSLLKLSEIYLSCSIIYGMIMDQFHQIIIAYGINQYYQLIIQIIKWKTKTILAFKIISNTVIWLIKDIKCIQEQQGINYPNQEIQFYTCGIQHLFKWTIKSGSMLKHESLPNIPAQSTMMVLNVSYHNKNKIIITGCQKGFIHIWKQKQYYYSIQLHTSCIRSLLKINNIIISAGMDGIIKIGFINDQYNYNSKKQLSLHNNSQNILQFNLNSEKQQSFCKNNQESTFMIKYDVQSLTNYKSTVYVGTRSGDIYHFQIQNNQIQKILSANDHQTIVSIAFGVEKNENLLFQLTISGQLCIWNLNNIKIEFRYNFFHKCQKIQIIHENILICMQKCIFIANINHTEQTINIFQNTKIIYDGIINYCLLSKKMKYLVISVDFINNKEIYIYQIIQQKDNNLYRISQVFKINNLKYNIDFIDFSIDQCYLLFKDKFQEIGMLNLLNMKRINTIFVEMQIQWQSSGLRISPKAQQLYSVYNYENKITSIKKLSEKLILVGDEMGTLRIYPYPCSTLNLGQPHLQCYTLHMNYINNIIVHSNKQWVVTTSIYDRTMIIWKKHIPQE